MPDAALRLSPSQRAAAENRYEALREAATDLRIRAYCLPFGAHRWTDPQLVGYTNHLYGLLERAGRGARR